MGGLGKTEIAIHLANEIEAETPNSTLWISVSDKSADDVQAEMAYKLGIVFPEGVGDKVRWELLRSHLQTNPKTVFFDDVRRNFLSCLRRCLPPSPPCAVMVTSRRSDLPGLPPGAIYSLDVMEPEQALSLLKSIHGLEKALEREPEATERLIAVCKCHPLALSLAASRLLKHLHDSNDPVATFTASLDDRLAGLRLDISGDPLRSLEENIRLSYTDLDEADQNHYRRLAVFASSGFSLEGAAALWGNMLPEARGALERFLDASLIMNAEVDGRWRLHDLLQEYAQKQLGMILVKKSKFGWCWQMT